MQDNKFPETVTLRGRTFSRSELAVIAECTSRNYEKGRTYISTQVCELLDWRQPNGWLKDRASRDVLRILESMGLIQLPPRKVQTSSLQGSLRSDSKTPVAPIPLIINEIVDMPKSVELRFAKGNKSERLWNQLVEQHHYLGHRVIVGRCIKYLVCGDEGAILGGIAFSSPAWRLQSRDVIMERMGVSTSEVREYVINNSRFLILPHVKIKNLASRVLGAATRQIAKDWEKYYSVKPIIVETFIQPSCYAGTCYTAANWVNVGATRGYRKQGAMHCNSQEPKQVLLYGLDRITRRKLAKATS
jgi:hypothetical protein